MQKPRRLIFANLGSPFPLLLSGTPKIGILYDTFCVAYTFDPILNFEILMIRTNSLPI